MALVLLTTAGLVVRTMRAMLAVDGGYDLLLTHHPLYLRGTTSVAATTYLYQ